MKELINIQKTLKAPKGQLNKFGNYKYRSCEDILEALKPLLYENKCVLTINDDIVSVGNRVYVKATVILKNESGEEISTTAFAREEETKKGMDSSQITGSTSSYARKYALNGMFCIDDTKDSDSYESDKNEKHVKQPTKPTETPQKKSLPRDKFDEITLMAWIYKKELEAKEKGARFSSYGLLENSYALTKEDINEITANYQEYKTNNNL
jgi:hypothetical protein